MGRLKNNEIICGKFVGRPGREILFFLSFFCGLGLPRRSFLLLFVSCLRHLRRAAEISKKRKNIYIYTAPDRLPRPQVQPRADQCARTYIYICVYINTDVLNMRLHLVEICQSTERSKTFKNTTCSTYRRTCPTYSVRSISRISILMLLISISSVTGLISKQDGTHEPECKHVRKTSMSK